MGENSQNPIVESMTAVLKREDESFGSSAVAHTICSFAGPMDHASIQDIAAKVEGDMIARGLSKSSVKKTFTILIEGLQNGFIHGLNHGVHKFLGVSILEVNGTIHINVLGHTDQANYIKVESLVQELNGMSKEELKAHYLQVMTNGKISEKGGAGLGLITMVMKSRTGIELSSHPLQDGSLIISSKTTV